MDSGVNGAVVREWPAATVDEMLRRHAAERPDDVALHGPSVQMTWAQLDLAAGRCAAVIAETGGVGSRVAWFGANDVGYASVLIGAWRQRSALVGLNWRLPDADLRACCEEVGVTHVFTSASFAERVRSFVGPQVHVEVVDETTSEPWAGRDPVAPLTPEAEDTAMVFFTSGSTGTPKAVPYDRLAVEIGASTPVVHGFDADSRLLIVPPVFHLAGAYWVQYGLLYGSRQSYIAEASPAAIVRTMSEQRITHAVFVPTLIRALIDRLREEPADLSSFRHLAYGASPITVAMLREALEVFDSEFCQVFGMTEAGGVVSYLAPEDHRIDGADSHRLGSAGRPTVGVDVQVRDMVTGDELPPDESGELWFRTPFMAHGYIDRPRQSAQVFVDGWVNTRDVGRVDQDGYIYVEGRSDDMIITGGENVHPGEVEQVLAEIPEVMEAAVFGAADEHWGQRVCAAVVARTPELDAETVRSHCRNRLAGYKVPREVVFLPELPKTATGKITRSSLPDVLGATT